MFIHNILIGFDNPLELSKIDIVSDKKMLFLENAVNGSRFKLDSKFIRHDDPVGLEPVANSNQHEHLDCFKSLYNLSVDGAVVINASTLNPFLLRSKTDKKQELIHIAINTKNVTLIKYDTSKDIISTMKNKKKNLVCATICSDVDSPGYMYKSEIMTLLCRNNKTGKYVKVSIVRRDADLMIETTEKLDKKELHFARMNTKTYNGRSLTFKYKSYAITKYNVCEKYPGEDSGIHPVYISVGDIKSYPCDKMTNIRWDLIQAIKDGVDSGDKLKALTLDKGIHLTFEEIYELKLSYVFEYTDGGNIHCVKSN